MCGLIGYSGNDIFDDFRIELLIAWNSFERGEDSTGIYSPLNGLKKSLTKGSHYVLYKDNVIMQDDIFIGHVRAATIGGKNDVKNAHPFERGNYILAHNGTLRNYKDLAHKYSLDESTYNVDSDYIAGCIEKCGNIKEVISQLSGAAALLITDKTNPKRLYAFRKGDTLNTNQRPLYRASDENGNMYISSSPSALYFLRLDKVKEFKEDVLYIIENGIIIQSIKIKNTPYSKLVTTTNARVWDEDDFSTQYDGYGGYGGFCGTNKRLNAGTSASHNSNNSNSNTTITPNTLIYEYATGTNGNDKYRDILIRPFLTIDKYDPELGARIHMIEGQYYLCLGTSYLYQNTIVFQHPLTKTRFRLNKSYFVQDDVIKEKDYVIAIKDVINKNGIQVLIEGELSIVDNVYWDGDVQLRSAHTNTLIKGYIPKSQQSLRKLTAQERSLLFYEDKLIKDAIGLVDGKVVYTVNHNEEAINESSNTTEETTDVDTPIDNLENDIVNPVMNNNTKIEEIPDYVVLDRAKIIKRVDEVENDLDDVVELIEEATQPSLTGAKHKIRSVQNDLWKMNEYLKNIHKERIN